MGDPLDSADPFVGPRSPWACWHKEILQKVRRMMRPPQRNRRLQFEVMESREVLSASLAVAPLAPPTLVIPIPPRAAGSAAVCTGCSAAAIRRDTLPDAGTTYDLSGQGQVQPFGQMNVTGSVHSPGFTPEPAVLKDHGVGTLTLSNSQGTLTLQLTVPVIHFPPGRSPSPAGPQPIPLPGPYHPILLGFPPQTRLFGFEITGGTGTFANVTGRGTASLRLVADPIGDVPGRHTESLGANGPLRLGPGGQWSVKSLHLTGNACVFSLQTQARVAAECQSLPGTLPVQMRIDGPAATACNLRNARRDRV